MVLDPFVELFGDVLQLYIFARIVIVLAMFAALAIEG
jgi:hypothetical protein